MSRIRVIESMWGDGKLFDQICAERLRQHKQWGLQSHPDGTGSFGDQCDAAEAKRICRRAFEHDAGTWRHILAEEVCEAFAESNPVKLREELIQVAAVCLAWCEALDRR